MRKSTLSVDQKRYVVQALACHQSQNDVLAWLRDECGVELSAAGIQHYDPTTLQGQELCKELTQLFFETRQKWNSNAEHVGLYHLRYRLETLQQSLELAKKRGNVKLMNETVEQAAKEVGGVFTKQRNVKVENLSVENRLCQLLNMTPEELCLPSKRPPKQLPPGDVIEGEVTEPAKSAAAKPAKSPTAKKGTKK
jgi:hypothetical protein